MHPTASISKALLAGISHARRSLTPLAGITLLFTGSALAQVVTVWEENFEGPLADSMVDGGNDGSLITALVADPDPEVGVDRGQVAVVDIGGTGRFGQILAFPENNILLSPLGIVPGTDTFTAKVDCYIPNDTTMEDTGSVDSTNLIIRWHSGNMFPLGSTTTQTFGGIDSLPRDEWFTLELTDVTIPRISGDGRLVTQVLPILSFHDVNDDAPNGTALFIDNVSFVATVSGSGNDPGIDIFNSVELPSIAASEPATASTFLDIPVVNTGVNNNLEIESVTLDGADADNFRIDFFPDLIAPGESDIIAVIFEPLGNPGFYRAEMTINSNVATDPVTVMLRGIRFENEREPTQFIVNSGFEFESIANWANPGDLAASSEQANTGLYSMEITLSSILQWQDIRPEQDSPPSVDGNPRSIEITPEMYGSPFTISASFLAPTQDDFPEDRQLFLISRINGQNATQLPFDEGGQILFEGRADAQFPLVFGEWNTFTRTGTIPPERGDTGEPTESVELFLSIRDLDNPVNDNDGGGKLFMDDVSFQVFFLSTSSIAASISYDRDLMQVTVEWESQVGDTFLVEYSSDLQIWNTLVTDFPTGGATGETASTTDSLNQGGQVPSKRFYRVTKL